MKKIALFIIISQLLLTNQEYNFDACTSNKTKCKSVSLSDKDWECCSVKADYYGNSYLNGKSISLCGVLTKQKMTKEMIRSAELLYRESYGFISTLLGTDVYSSNNLYSFSFLMTYDCPSQSFSVDYKIGDSYTSEEKAIFKRDDYCLKLYYQGLMDINLLPEGFLTLEKKEIQKSDCLNAKVLPNSEEYATCAYASFTFKLINGTTLPLSSCLYISKSSFDTKNLDEHLSQSFSSYTKLSGVAIESYEIEITDKNNKILKYDSKTKMLTSNSSSADSSKYIIGVNKIISIMLIFYLF